MDCWWLVGHLSLGRWWPAPLCYVSLPGGSASLRASAYCTAYSELEFSAGCSTAADGIAMLHSRCGASMAPKQLYALWNYLCEQVPADMEPASPSTCSLPHSHYSP